MALSSATTVLGVFEDPSNAARAIEQLKKEGFADNDIGVASKDWSKKLASINVEDQKTAEHGAVGGAVMGGGLGAVLGIVGAIAVPGLIPIVAGGAIVSVLLGAAAGAAGGAFAGPFLALGFSETDANEHAEHVVAGKTVLIVYARDRKDQARNIMVREGAYDESMSTSA